MYRLATKGTCTEIKRIEENASVFLRQTIRRALVVLRSVIPGHRELWSVTLEWIEFG